MSKINPTATIMKNTQKYNKNIKEMQQKYLMKKKIVKGNRWTKRH